MSKEKNICAGYNKSVGMTELLYKACYPSQFKCDCKGVLFENGKWYCKRHAPSKIAEREKKSWQTYQKKIFKNIEMNTPK